VGYTGLHYAAKDAYSLTGVIITVSFFTLLAVLPIPITIIILIVWATVRLVQRHKARHREQATTAASPMDISSAAPPPSHRAEHPVPYRIRGIDRGSSHADLFCYDRTCGETVADITPSQAAARLHNHLHDGVDWTTTDPNHV